jgi:hypothetical protein
VNAGDDFGEVFLDSQFSVSVVLLELGQDAGDVAPIAREEFTGIGRLEVADTVGIQAVETHARKSFVDGAERGQPGGADEIQAIEDGHGSRLSAFDNIARFYSEVLSLAEGLCGVNLAFFILNLEAALWTRSNPKRVVADFPRRE